MDCEKEQWRAYFKQVLTQIEQEKELAAEQEEEEEQWDFRPVLIDGVSYFSYYPIFDRITEAESRGVFYSNQNKGEVLICGRFEGIFLLELFKAGELLAKVLWIDGGVAEALEAKLILGDTAPGALLDESIDEDDEAYWQKEDFEKIDLFLQKNYHLYADEPNLEQLAQLPIIEQNENIRLYDGRQIGMRF